MATTAVRRRAPIPRNVKKADIEDLTNQLATKLKVESNTTTKPATSSRATRKPADPSIKSKTGLLRKSEDDRKTSLMKNINSTLQSLSTAIQANWKAAGRRQRVTFNNVDMLASAKSARCSLSLLRGIMQGNLDVEKAASSLVGKLLSVDMFISATEALKDIRDSLVTMYEGEDINAGPQSTGVLALLQLPVPSSPIDSSLQAIVSSYFSYALTSVLQLSLEQSLVDSSFLTALSAPGCFASWIPHLSSLPNKTIDTILKRNYMTLTSAISDTTFPATIVLQIRFFALRSVLLSSEVDANPFWDQCVKFAGSYIRTSVKSADDDHPDAVLNCFNDVVHCAEQRRCDDGLMSGTSWVAFCEYWLIIARNANDIKIVDRVVRYIQKSPTSSRTLIPPSSSTSVSDSDASYNATKICAGLMQLTAVMDSTEDAVVDDMDNRCAFASELLREYRSMIERPDTPLPVASKLKRLAEKLRRSLVKRIQKSTVGKEGPRKLLDELVQCLLSDSKLDSDSTISILDSLINLATSSLDLQRAETCNQAYDYLMKAEDVIQSYASVNNGIVSQMDEANYLRCVAGAYYNVAGNLYKADKHGFAIRFLRRACPLAEFALQKYDKAMVDAPSEMPNDDSKRDDKDREVWISHRSQVYRRWELLGVCYTKLPDRKLAHEAFVKAIATFPYDGRFSSKVLGDPSTDIFSLPEYKAVGVLIDRVTYIGAAELFLDKATSLLEAVKHLSPEVAIAVLERQIASLNESKWKPAIGFVVEHLLSELQHVLGDDQPIRKAKLFITQLDHLYFSGNAIQKSHVEEVSNEVRRVLDMASDASPALRHAKLFYSALAHLWLALIMHAVQLSDSNDIVLSHSNEAHGFLSALLSDKADSSGNGKPSAPLKVNAKGLGIKRGLPSKPNTTRVPKTPKTSARSIEDESLKEIDPPQDMKEILSVTRIVIELLGLMGHTYAKMQLLVIVRQLAVKFDSAADELEASIDFGFELVKLGKLSQAIEIYASALKNYGNDELPSGPYVLLQLRYAEALAIEGDLTDSVSMYEKALDSSELLNDKPDRSTSTLVRTRGRVMAIERSAVASVVFGTIQLAKDSPTMALKSYLQALRLLNRSVDCLSKLTMQKSSSNGSESQDPFADSNVENSGNGNSPHTAYKRTMLSGHEWRVASSLFDVMFTLSTVYFLRGSCRESEFFAKQLEDLARSMSSPAVLCRALSRQSELLLHLGRLDEANEKVAEASQWIRPSLNVVDSAETSRLKGDRFQKLLQLSDAGRMYEAAAKTLEEIGETFVAFDHHNDRRRKSNISTPKSPQSIKVPVAPSILAVILKQHIWLLRDNEQNFDSLLKQFTDLPQTADVQAQANSLFGRLALHNIHERFLRDMALNSLAESTVALPMGMLCEGSTLRPPSRDVIDALDGAEDIYATGLITFYERGNIAHMRDSAVSLALVKAFQAALGATGKEGPALAARFLDLASSITLQKELVESIQYKFPGVGVDDLQWPSFATRTAPTPRRRLKTTIQNIFDDDLPDDDDDEQEGFLQKYWQTVLDRHKGRDLTNEVRDAELKRLPSNWVVVSISLTDDKNTLLLSRQCANKEPFVFCVPLRGRRENDGDEHFTFEDAMAELKDIIDSSQEATKQASQIEKDDKEAKAAWWAGRKMLDERMRCLLENIEFCWLGAFKTILTQPMRMPHDIIPTFRTRIEKVFKDMLKPHEKKFKRTKFKFETCLLELFAMLPANCRDEELEDIIYFILDLYHFHGVQISSADIDVDIVGIDLRTAIEEHHRRSRGRIVPEPEAHMFLVLDKNVQSIPWESIPILRGKSISRIPSVSFLLDRLDLAMMHRGMTPTNSAGEIVDRIDIDPSRAYYVLNPAGDLTGTEGRFKDWLEKMRRVGWEGVVGKPPSEQQLINAFSCKDLVVYFGHGGAEQYVRSHKIRHLQRCAATMLWGCSSGALRDMGDFDRTGTPNNYMLAGCPTLVASLWDVTDRDIDKFALSVFEKLALQPEEVGKWQTGRKGAADCRTSVVAAVAQSRDVCKLKYLTGAAVVVYGIPFFL